MSQAPAHQFEWWDHIFILHALKVGLAGLLALFVAEALRLQYPQWSLFTVMVLMVVQYPGSQPTTLSSPPDASIFAFREGAEANEGQLRSRAPRSNRVEVPSQFTPHTDGLRGLF
jgi:hypothetical protein